MVREKSPDVSRRKLLMFKWLMVVIPPVAITLGHSVLGYVLGYPEQHSVGDVLAGRLVETMLLAFLAFVVAYIFAELIFTVVRNLHAEALAREQDFQAMNAVMQERTRLSRELHDGAAQLVAQLLIRLDTIKELVQAGSTRQAETELERLHGIANEIYDDIGESITGLRADVMEKGLINALGDYLGKFEERSQVATNLRADGPANDLSPLKAFHVFRLIQEALTNIRKHSAARQAAVSLISSGTDELKVVISDDGKGFVPDAQGNGRTRALGLTSMRERVESLSGTLQVNSQPGSGTQVIAIIPTSRSTGEREYGAITNTSG